MIDPRPPETLTVMTLMVCTKVPWIRCGAMTFCTVKVLVATCARTSTPSRVREPSRYPVLGEMVQLPVPPWLTGVEQVIIPLPPGTLTVML